ncbi:MULTISPECIES: zinc-binding dehydrogenase [Acetobacteraceae]|uniref:Zinc-binding dehydrogenase n=1 Tax=Brytella acorum TaxID=2959299 RepID=A0AA35VFG9_9PROT|nr:MULTISPECIES: zinc-binding dehydrogenase [Acetobacteraceae]CAI9122226.1 zinc-binding dehydrogenase [Brytella acorum]
MLEDLARAWTASGLRPVIDSVFPFARAREAFDHLMTGSHVGKIVIALSRTDPRDNGSLYCSDGMTAVLACPVAHSDEP